MQVWFVLVWPLIFASAINGSAQRTPADFIKQAKTRERYKDYNGAIASCNHIQLNPGIQRPTSNEEQLDSIKLTTKELSLIATKLSS